MEQLRENHIIKSSKHVYQSQSEINFLRSFASELIRRNWPNVASKWTHSNDNPAYLAESKQTNRSKHSYPGVSITTSRKLNRVNYRRSIFMGSNPGNAAPLSSSCLVRDGIGFVCPTAYCVSFQSDPEATGFLPGPE